MTTRQRQLAFSRREFLGTMGAVAVSASGIGAIQQTLHRGFVLREDRFSRMFPGLPPFAEPGPALEAALSELGKPGGIMDARDALDRGPVDLIVDLTLSENNRNSSSHSAGVTFMGQFMDHDMTFDLTSKLGQPQEPADSPNARTPAFDLDSVYGGGPIESRELYERANRRRGGFPTRFKLESGGLFEDLPRNSDSVAIISDPRNDENLMIAGLHAAFLKFHNNAVDYLERRTRRLDPEDLFRLARRLTTWHYQWIIVHEILPLFVGQPMIDDILSNGRRFYRPSRVTIPVEFQGAAFRFGHSMVRPSYRANLNGDNGAAFFGMIFDPSQEGASDPTDLRGGARARRRFIGWETFFDFGDGNMRPNKTIDTKISTPLFHLPLGTIADQQPPISLPQRNLLRQITWELPSGQSVAARMGVTPLSPDQLSELAPFGQNLVASTPLWYYVLKEAEVVESGQRLGPVGGRIVAEVILGLLQLDRRSYFSERRFRPTLPARTGERTGEFTMLDFLAFAGVDPDGRSG